METITVRAVPLGQRQQWLDCSKCGPIGITPTILVRHTAALHLEEHGIDATRLKGPEHMADIDPVTAAIEHYGDQRAEDADNDAQATIDSLTSQIHDLQQALHDCQGTP